jgi:hypothetical protein
LGAATYLGSGGGNSKASSDPYDRVGQKVQNPRRVGSLEKDQPISSGPNTL